MYVNRWVTFVACALIQCCAGLDYAWSIVAPAIKLRRNYDESQVDTVGAMLLLGGYAAVLVGVVTDALSHHHRLGPRLVLWVGVLLFPIGYAGLYAMVTAQKQPVFGAVMLFAFIAGHSAAWFDVACITTCVRNFPNDRGTIVGILKGFVGLSASIYASIYAAGFEPDAMSFLLFLALAPAALGLIASAFVNHVPLAYREAETIFILETPSTTTTTTTASLPRCASDAKQAAAAATAASHLELTPLVDSSTHQHAGPSSHAHSEISRLSLDGGHCKVSLPGATPQPSGSTGVDQQQLTMSAPQGTADPKRSRVCLTKASRFGLIYLVVGAVAVYQLATTLYMGAHPALESQETSRLLTAIMLGVLSLLLLVPLYSGGFLPAPAAADGGDGAAAARLASDGGVSRQVVSGEERASLLPAAPIAPSYRQERALLLGSAAYEGKASQQDKTSPSRPASSSASTHQERASLLRPAEIPDSEQQDEVEEGSQHGKGGSSSADMAPSPLWHVISLDQVSSSLPRTASGDKALSLPRTSSGDKALYLMRTSSGDKALELLVLEAPPKDLTILQAMRTVSFWLLFMQLSIGVGTGLTLLNNLGSIVVALGGPVGGQVVFVSLFSVSNAMGRLLFGFVSERYFQSHGTSRTLFLVLSSAMTLLVAACASQARIADLYPLSLLAGVAFGGHWSVVPAIASDLFGLRNFASIYTSLQLAPAGGAVLMASLLAGHMYDKATEAHGGGHTCVGVDCYQMTWYIIAGANVASLLGTCALMRITRPAYARMRRAAAAARAAGVAPAPGPVMEH